MFSGYNGSMGPDFYIAKDAMIRLHEKHGLHRFCEFRQYMLPTGELVLLLYQDERPEECLRIEIPPKDWVASLRLH